MNEVPELDDSQKAVAFLPADSRTIVIAGAGQGKTELVAARLDYLVADEGLSPFDEVLVLSFSRAAVQAVRQRLKGTQSAAQVSVRTIDSFATHLLFEAGKDPAGRTFDQRVQDAVTVLKNLEHSNTLEYLRHIIIDEIQDVVGDRSMLIVAILCRLAPNGAGFTVLGDPLQAIYDFQLKKSSDGSASDVLLSILKAHLNSTEFSLTGNYRALSDDAHAVVELGDQMRQIARGAQRLTRVSAFVRLRSSLGTARDLAPILRRWKGTTAILCMTNGETLEVSRLLVEQGVSHRVRRSAEDLSLPAWVAVAFANAPRKQLTEAEVLQLIGCTPDSPPAEEAWDLLKSVEGNRFAPDHLDLDVLSLQFQRGDIPVALADLGEAEVIVSTIHKAKGLQFDNVIVLETPDPNYGDHDADERERLCDERARVLYVAISRARSRIHVIRPESKTRTVSTFSTASSPSRLQVTAFPGAKGRPLAFELLTSDIDRQVPRLDTQGARAEAVVESIRKGSLAYATLEGDGRLTRFPRYRLEQEGRVLGHVAPMFAESLRKRIGEKAPWPTRLDSIVIDGVETVAGSESGNSGGATFWLGIRAGGLADLTFPDRDDKGSTA